jgi:hypothetical protein
MTKHTGPTPHYGLVGDGRLARHLSHYFSLLALPFTNWSRRAPVPDLEKADVVLLAIRDQALAGFLDDFARERGVELRDGRRRFVHFSGAWSVDGLTGAHPLASFGTELYPETEYREIPFFCETGEADFRRLFPTLPNPCFALDPARKARYHAHAVLGGNFTTLLWKRLFRHLRDELGVPTAAALPYLRSVVRNLERDPGGALTGPLARGEVETLRRDIQGLAGDAAATRIFESFVEAERPDLAERLKN